MEIKTKLEDNEYLLKVRDHDNFGYMTKYNKNGSMPKAFESWSRSYQTGEDLPIQIHVEEFKKGWKFISYRTGESQSWATVQHPDGFKLEVYLSNMMDVVKYATIVKGEIIGKFKWEGKKLVSAISEKTRERTEKFGKLQHNILSQEITDEVLKTENEDLLEMWNKYQDLK